MQFQLSINHITTVVEGLQMLLRAKYIGHKGQLGQVSQVQIDGVCTPSPISPILGCRNLGPCILRHVPVTVLDSWHNPRTHRTSWDPWLNPRTQLASP